MWQVVTYRIRAQLENQEACSAEEMIFPVADHKSWCPH